MKVIFLDIDGVLNGTQSLNDPTTTNIEFNSIDWWSYYIDESKVKRLNRIIKETDGVVVLSTSWRLQLTQGFITQVLEAKGFEGFIIGSVPDLSMHRSNEIQAWLNYANSITSYVILDDDYMTFLGNNQVKTDSRFGLQDEHVQDAIRIISY